jgi:hypothetical protein
MPLVPIVAALLVLAVGASVVAAPRAPHSPQRIAVTGNVATMASLLPALAARIRGGR